MARYKVKGKDCQLKVKVKLSFKEEIDERQLDFFSSKYIRGLLKVQAKKKNCIEFYGLLESVCLTGLRNQYQSMIFSSLWSRL